MKKLLAITLTLTLVVGLFSLTSRADTESDMDETTAVENVEEPVKEESNYEDSGMEETDQEEIEGEDQETIQEKVEQSDDNSIEEPDMQEPEKSDEEYYMYDRTWEDDEFVYELESEDPSDVDTRLVLTKTCKQCGLCDFDVITQQQVLQRFGIDLHK